MKSNPFLLVIITIVVTLMLIGLGVVIGTQLGVVECCTDEEGQAVFNFDLDYDG